MQFKCFNLVSVLGASLFERLKLVQRAWMRMQAPAAPIHSFRVRVLLENRTSRPSKNCFLGFLTTGWIFVASASSVWLLMLLKRFLEKDPLEINVDSGQASI